MATGSLAAKMLRPMSTPEAPWSTARQAMSRASASGIFLPPAMTIGTGHPATTSSKCSSQK